MKKLFVLTVALLMLFSSACGRVENEKTPFEEDVPSVPGTDISYSNGTLVAKYSEIADFSDLSTVNNPDEIENLEIYLNSGEELVLPEFPNVKNLNIEITESVKSLDISAAENLEQLTLFGKAEELCLPQNLESISVYGQTDLSLFAEGESISNVYVMGATDLEPLGLFPNLKNVFIMASGCDLSPLNNISFSDLRLSGVTDEELAVINGCPAVTLQISDETVLDLSIIERMPNLDTVFFTVASGENPYVTDFMEPTEDNLGELATPADISCLKEFIKNGGTLYLMSDQNR